MRLIFAFLIALLAAVAAPAVYAEPADIAATARSVVRVVLIGAEGGEPSLVGHGSGIAVAPDLILTNAHVVEAAREDDTIRIGLVPPQGKSGWFGRVVAFAPKADLALIKLTERGALPPATLFTGPVGDGSDVVAVGYPGNVDVAQGLNVGDIVSPTSPVKTRGSVSSGRSSKSFDTILHTAPIGAGNSGGPLLDPCGRVIGINSFGTLSQDGDSEFYFAVSGAEVMRFLRSAGVQPHTTGIACRSLAEIDRAEADRAAGERVHTEEEARALAARQRDAHDKAERAALFEVLAARDTGMALAALALVLALAAGGGAYALGERGRRRDARIAGGVAGLLVLAAIAAWLLRPGFGEIDERAAQATGSAGPAASGSAGPGKPGGAGALVCTLDLPRSRITVSDGADVAPPWGEGGCVDGRRTFAPAGTEWSRVTLSESDDSATVARFDPATRSYRADRYFVGLDTIAKLRAEEARAPAAATCGDAEAARRESDRQAALRALLPETPNERLVYDCR